MLIANLFLAAVSGLVGAIVLTVLVYIFSGVGIKMDIPYLLGTRFSKSDSKSQAYIVGIILFLLIGAFWGFFYVTLMMGLSELPSWEFGLLYGFGHGFFMGVIISTFADSHPKVGEGKLIPDPGMFGANWGALVPAAIIIAHMIFGVITIFTYNHIYHPVHMPRV